MEGKRAESGRHGEGAPPCRGLTCATAAQRATGTEVSRLGPSRGVAPLQPCLRQFV